MELLKTRIHIGLDRPFSALHLTDHHIAFADERDDLRKRELAASRRGYFDAGRENTTRFLTEHLAYAKERGLPVLYTGDLCDFVSWKNQETAMTALAPADYFMAVGNHEYSLYVGEAFEDLPYKMQSYEFVQRYFRNNLFFASREIGGVNFVAADDGYYLFDESQLARLKDEVKKGLPIVLLLHNPLHTDDLFDFMVKTLGHECAYLTGSPDSALAGYDEYRRRQQTPDAPTRAFVDFVLRESAIRAILTGHLHENFETALPSGIPQIVTGAGYKGFAREILFE